MIIHGRNTVDEAIKLGITKNVYMREGSTYEIKDPSIAVFTLSRREFVHRYGEEAQGVAAEINDIDPKDFATHVDKIEGPVVMLDRIFDPQNYGAIIRAANCFGIKNVLVSKHKQSPVTAAVCKSSSGTIFHTNIYEATNLNTALKALQDKGYFSYAADIDGKTELKDVPFAEKAIIILGSEGRGIRPGLLDSADMHLVIPMSGDIDSLNVSQSAAVLFYSYTISMNK